MDVKKIIIFISFLGLINLEVYQTNGLKNFLFYSGSGNSKASMEKSLLLKRSQVEKRDIPKINLTIALIDKESSIGDDELYSVKLRLKLNFTSESDVPILIYKGWSSISHVWISENEEKAVAKEFEASIHQSISVEGGKSVEELTIEDFMVLNKGKSFK